MMFCTTTSENHKTGNIPQCYSPSLTCPDRCGHKKAGSCYAACGNTSIWWHRADANWNQSPKGSWQGFIEWVNRIPPNQLWRYGVAGDLPGENLAIDAVKLQELVHANHGRKGYTYTHKPLDYGDNADAIRFANQNGFTINLSADYQAQADELMASGAGPVCLSVPEDAPEVGSTPNGHEYVVCPAQSRGVQCATCSMCSNPDRRYIIAFRVHGTNKGRAADLVNGNMD